MESLIPDQDAGRWLLHFAADRYTAVQIKALAICAAWIGRAETAEQQKSLAVFIGYYSQFTPENQKVAIESMRQLCRKDDMDRYQARARGGGKSVG